MNPSINELPSYSEVLKNRTEKRVDDMGDNADVVIDTSRCTIGDVAVRAAASLGLYGRDYQRLVDVIVGGGYGSEGKGQIAAYLSDEYDLLVRVGGPNAGHTVFEVPTPYTFHHLPSGARATNARLLLGPGAVIHVPTLLKEISECRVSAERLCIDKRAMLISDLDRVKEGELERNIGSTRQGVGWATARKILYRGTDDVDDPVRLAEHEPDLRPYICDASEVLDMAFSAGNRVLLEGTQGTGLSLHHGFYPYVTSRDTTVAGCLAESGISPTRVRKVVVVCRTYPIRVQDPKEDGKTSGPMSQPTTWEEISERSGISVDELKQTEKTSTTKRQRRVAEFDWRLLRKSASLNAPTDIAITFADYLSVKNRDARRYEQLAPDTKRFLEEVERVAAAPVSLISTRFHSRAIIDRRSW